MTANREMQKTISQIKHEAAKAQAESDIDIRFADKSAEVAWYEYLKDQRGQREGHKGPFPESNSTKAETGRRKGPAWESKRRSNDRRQSAFESDTKAGRSRGRRLEHRAAADRAPFDGVVTNVYRHPGEWVAPGDPVIKVIQVDRLRIEGSLSAAEYDPPEIDGRPVTIEAELAHGRKVTFTGKVVFVSPLVSLGRRVRGVCRSEQSAGKWSMGA